MILNVYIKMSSIKSFDTVFPSLEIYPTEVLTDIQEELWTSVTAKALADVAQLIGCRSTKPKVTGLITSWAHAWVVGSISRQGACERQPINVSLLPFLPPSSSL